MQAPGGTTGVGVQIVNAPNSPAPTDPNALVKPIAPANNALPGAEAPAVAPNQVNDIKNGDNPAPDVAAPTGKQKKPKVDQSDESSSKKKKKKGLAKIF
jgi:outer membrane protein assembly factor BamD